MLLTAESQACPRKTVTAHSRLMFKDKRPAPSCSSSYTPLPAPKGDLQIRTTWDVPMKFSVNRQQTSDGKPSLFFFFGGDLGLLEFFPPITLKLFVLNAM